MVEKAYFIEDIAGLGKLPVDTARVYLGSEYCIRAYPPNFERLILKAKDMFPVTLLTPPLLESELGGFLKFFDVFKKHAAKRDEAVINDWGVFDLLSRQKKRRHSLSLGRFFSYQKRGTQNLYDSVEGKELSSVPVLDELMVGFLRGRGIERVEIDFPKHGISVENCPDIKLSVYEPYALNSYTLNCPYTFDKGRWKRKCRRECLSVELMYGGKEASDAIVQKGKAYYTKSYFSSFPCIDRVVKMRWKTPRKKH